MNHESSLDKLLATDPADVGCDGTFELLDVYWRQLPGSTVEPDIGSTSAARSGALGEEPAGFLAQLRPQPTTRGRPGAPWCRRTA